MTTTNPAHWTAQQCSIWLRSRRIPHPLTAPTTVLREMVARAVAAPDTIHYEPGVVAK